GTSFSAGKQRDPVQRPGSQGEGVDDRSVSADVHVVNSSYSAACTVSAKPWRRDHRERPVSTHEIIGLQPGRRESEPPTGPPVSHHERKRRQKGYRAVKARPGVQRPGLAQTGETARGYSSVCEASNRKWDGKRNARPQYADRSLALKVSPTPGYQP